MAHLPRLPRTRAVEPLLALRHQRFVRTTTNLTTGEHRMKIDLATMFQILAMFKIVCHVTITHGQVYLNNCSR